MTDAAGSRGAGGGLAAWFAVWHPRYRSSLGRLLVAGVLASGLIYVQNELLGLLTASLAAAPGGGPGGWVDRLAGLAGALGLGPPLFFLGCFVLVRIMAASLSFWDDLAGGRLTIRAKDDLEAEILAHLLRRDDAFFSRHSPAETVNRLAVDLQRVSARRQTVMGVCGSALVLAGNLTFFCLKDWRLALVALAACAAGALWTLRMTRPVREMDAGYLEQDDRAKSGFEDLLRAAPEIQVGRLFAGALRRFGLLQSDRARTYLRYVRMSAALGAGNTASYLLAFTAMIGVVLYMRGTGSGSTALALVPVVVWTLPALFGNASALVFSHTALQLEGTSCRRLLEYEARERGERAESGTAPAAAAAAGQARPLRLEDVSYRHAGPDGAPGAGVAEVSTEFAPGRWTAVVGGAGSGKSTMLNLALGRLRPRTGRVRYGPAPLESLPEAELGAVLTFMPQSPVLLDLSVGENLLFGRAVGGEGEAGDACGRRPFPGGGLDEDDLAVIEAVGLGRVCRLKALDLLPASPEDLAGRPAGIGGVRERVRRRLAADCGVNVRPFEAGGSDPGHWVLERLLGGRCDRRQAAETLLGRPAAGVIDRLARSGPAVDLAEFGRRVLRETRHLLAMGSHGAYAQLAPFPLGERLWQLRADHLGLADGRPASPRELRGLCLVALTGTPAELGGGRAPADGGGPAAAELAGLVGPLRGLLGDAFRAFAAGEVHPHLTWRENLVFGTVDVRNSRSGRLADDAVLECAETEGLGELLTRAGLRSAVGRSGGNLSGGQGQMIALCRALLRRTPVVVLDEPTSSLDPAGRARVAALLRSWKEGRIVITVSHDPELVREADEVRVMEGGRLAASGAVGEMEERLGILRRTGGGA